MKTMTIYLAGPIDDVTGKEARAWRRMVADMAPVGCLFFDPSRAWHGVSTATAQAVDIGNRVTIHYADGVLVNLSGEGRGFGTIREIEFARMHGKPVAVATGDTPIESLLQHDLIVRRHLEDAFDALLDAIRSTQDQPVNMLRSMGFQVPDDDPE